MDVQWFCQIQGEEKESQEERERERERERENKVTFPAIQTNHAKNKDISKIWEHALQETVYKQSQPWQRYMCIYQSGSDPTF